MANLVNSKASEESEDMGEFELPPTLTKDQVHKLRQSITPEHINKMVRNLQELRKICEGDFSIWYSPDHDPCYGSRSELNDLSAVIQTELILVTSLYYTDAVSEFK